MIGRKDCIQWNLVCQVTGEDNSPNKHVFSEVEKAGNEVASSCSNTGYRHVPDITDDTHLFTYLLTPRCRVLLEHLTGLQLVRKFPEFHGIQKFITALTSVRHLSLSWVSPIQSIYPHPTSCRSILILSTHLRLGLPSGLFPSSFPTKTLYNPLSSSIRATCPAYLILLEFIIRIILGEEYKSFSSSLCNLLRRNGTSHTIIISFDSAF